MNQDKSLKEYLNEGRELYSANPYSNTANSLSEHGLVIQCLDEIANMRKYQTYAGLPNNHIYLLQIQVDARLRAKEVLLEMQEEPKTHPLAFNQVFDEYLKSKPMGEFAFPTQTEDEMGNSVIEQYDTYFNILLGEAEQATWHNDYESAQFKLGEIRQLEQESPLPFDQDEIQRIQRLIGFE